jgi:hypothetical protein
MLERAFRFFTSLKLTVVCLAVGIVLVFVGTLAQVQHGLYAIQERYFQSLFVWWGPEGAGWRIPIFPGGYLVGLVMLLSLGASFFRQFKVARRNVGLILAHLGIILLLAGQLLTDQLSEESVVRFAEGETRSYAEAMRARDNELALTDSSAPDSDLVVSVPEALLAKRKEIRLPSSPFTLQVRRFWPNVDVLRQASPDAVASGATQGTGAGLYVRPKPLPTQLEERSVPAALIEVFAGPTSLGTWLASLGLQEALTFDRKSYSLEMRPTRYYTPFSLTLLKTTHEVYPGTDIPKNFQSRVRIDHPGKGEKREVDIYMNNPLRYGGLTFYQYQMGRDEADANRGTSVLQTVRNPGWLTPYLGCVLVGLGLLIQFTTHLVGFIRERRIA